MMAKRFAVIGLGNFGMALAAELAALGGRVLAVDVNAERAREAQAFVDQAVVTDATEITNLKAVGLAETDVATVSLGGRMEASILVVLHLTRLGVPEIVAKALTEDHGEILRRVGATRVVFPEKEMAHRVAERVSSRNVLDYLSLASGFGVLELAPPQEMVGKSLSELDLTRRFGVQVVAVKELVPERIHITPPPARVVKDSDILVVYGPREAVRKLKEA